ncbi:MAG: glucose-6-phosphate dehydrogenase assembly protein OpcA [Candidatus Dormibacteraceae bacterium]
MSTTIAPEPDVWRGEGVSMGEVLVALSNIRKKFAMAEADDKELPHPRNCVMTLLAVASTDAEERRAQRAVRAIGIHHPAQVIVIRDQPELRDGRIDATITTDTLRPKLGCAMQCELITLRVRGAAGEHLAALIDPMLQSGVPNYLWWVGTPAFGERELEDVLRICDGLFVDSARFDAPYRSFLQLKRLVSHSHQRLGVGDLQWARLEPWRESVAQFFAPMNRRPFLDGISEIGVDYSGEGRGNRVAAALLIGWLASALGWKLQKAAGGAGGIVVAHFTADSWRPVQVAFRSVPRTHLAQGEIGAIRIGGSAAGRTFNLSVLRDPERARNVRPEVGAGGYRSLHPAGGEDEAGLEIAQRQAERHRDVLQESAEQLHHTATGDLPGDHRRQPPGVVVGDRRRQDNSRVLLTLIEIGEAGTLRHVQHVEPEDEATLLLELLARGAQDRVFGRSLTAAAELMESI